MHVFTPSILLTTFYLITSYTSAHPRPTRRGLPGAFYACPQSNWQPSSDHECHWISIPSDYCTRLDDGKLPPGFTIGSLVPDEFGWCNMYNTPDCNGTLKGTYIGALKFPGNTDTTRWNIKSVYCSACGMVDCADVADPLEFTLGRLQHGKGP